MTDTRSDTATTNRSEATDTDATRPTPRRGPGPVRPAADAVDDSATVASRLDRRDYLKALGAAGAAASLAGAATGSAGAQSDDWEAEAEERIQEHRTGELEVVVEDDAGSPVSGADVEVEMQRHDYNFGTAVHAEFLRRGTEWDDPVDGTDEEDVERYRETIEELFNTIVLENHHKWLIWEEDQENYEDEDELPIADWAVEWALERDMDVRGHVCLWGNVDAWAVPPDVAGAMGVGFQDHDDWEGIDEDPEYVEEQSMAHLERIVEHYGDDIYEWEVVNEVINEPDMIYGVDGDGVDPQTAPILGDWYERAEELTEEYDVGIAVNDFNTMANADDTDVAYEEQVDYLVNERGVDLDGVGFQCHFGWYGPESQQTRDPEGILEFCDRFADYGVGLRTTEFDMFEGDGWDRENQAEYLHTYLKTWFSHEATEAFLMWGHWDPLHWGDELGHDKDAPLFEDDWTPKPAYDVWVDLVYDEWWTEESGTTGSDGTFSTDAFLGEHEVTVTVNGETVTETVEVTDPDGTTTVAVGGGTVQDPCEEADAADGEELENGDWVCDVDGDGNYRDVNAEGEVTSQDLSDFFQNQHRDPWDSRDDLFDFNGDGNVGQPDVVDLFDNL